MKKIVLIFIAFIASSVSLKSQDFAEYNFTVSGEKMSFSLPPYHLSKAEYRFIYDHNFWEPVATYALGLRLKAKKITARHVDTIVKAILWDNLSNQSLGTVREVSIRIYNTPIFGGYSELCPNQEGQYAVMNLPPNSIIHWTYPSTMYPTAKTDSSRTLINISETEMDELFQAKVTLSDGRVLPILTQKVHLFGTMFTNTIIRTDDYNEFVLELNAQQGTDFYWRTPHGEVAVQGYNWTCINFSAGGGSVEVICDYTNQCGDRMHAYGGFELPVKMRSSIAVFSTGNTIEIRLQTPDHPITAKSVNEIERGIHEIEICSYLGSKVLKQKLSKGLMKVELNISTLPKGVYIARVYDGVEWKQTKFTKE